MTEQEIAAYFAAKKKRIERADAIATSLIATGAIAAGIFKGAAATTVVVGATAAPGAIKTTTLIVGGQKLVYSLVSASVGTKILVGVCTTLFVGGITFLIYNAFIRDNI